MWRERGFDIETHYSFFDFARASVSQDLRQFSCLSKTKGVRRIRICRGRFDVLGHDIRHTVAERIDFALVPDRQSKPATQPGDTQHLAHRVKWIGNEHDAQPADGSVKGVVRKG